MIPFDRIQEILAEVDKYEITLAHDPTVLGPKYLQDQIATCRNYTNHVARLVNEVHRASMAVDGDYRRKETAFKIAADELLARHPNVKNLPNIADRQAQINLFLRDEHRELEALKNDLRDMQHVEKYVRNKHRELKDTMNDIKLQRSLIRDEIDTGRMYGDERPSDRENAYTAGAGARPDDIDEDELARMLSGETSVEVEASIEPAVPEQSVEVEETVDVTEEVDTSETIEASETTVSEPIVEAPQAEAVAVEAPKSPSKSLTEDEQVTAFLDKKPAPKAAVLSTDLPNLAQNAISEQDYSDLFEQM
jgi:hypothetical protein